MLTPKQYLSYSQMVAFEKSPENYADIYLRGIRTITNQSMRFGSKMAEGLEDNEATGDPVLDAMMSRIPKFELMDKVIESSDGEIVDYFDPRTGKTLKVRIPVLRSGGIRIPILARPDSAKADYLAFKEYKTGMHRWTQKAVDESSQITFYGTAAYLATGKVTKDIELVHVWTEKTEYGEIAASGSIDIIKTQRNLAQILGMMVRMKKVWKGIKKLTEETLL